MNDSTRCRIIQNIMVHQFIITPEFIQAMDSIVTIIICIMISAAVYIKMGEDPDTEKDQKNWWE